MEPGAGKKGILLSQLPAVATLSFGAPSAPGRVHCLSITVVTYSPSPAQRPMEGPRHHPVPEPLTPAPATAPSSPRRASRKWGEWGDNSPGKAQEPGFLRSCWGSTRERPMQDKLQPLCFLLNFPLCLQKGKKWVLSSSRSHGQGLHWHTRRFSGLGWDLWS